MLPAALGEENPIWCLHAIPVSPCTPRYGASGAKEKEKLLRTRDHKVPGPALCLLLLSTPFLCTSRSLGCCFPQIAFSVPPLALAFSQVQLLHSRRD